MDIARTTLRIDFASYVRHIIAQTDIAALECEVYGLVRPLKVPVQVGDPAVVLAELLDTAVRHKAPFDKALLENRGYPVGIFYVGFPTGKLPDEVGIDQLDIKIRFQDTPQRYPVHARALHSDMADMKFHQRITQTLKIRGQGTEYFFDLFP
ncbi:hypothetical protein GCM10011386_02770 [Parapedobacter defluvii]|uniref:Uncharacterized protein n=1 Tax=Parapedobacter defluvii TaxID=2045106 RepID=A0ABQ1L1N6_9SPHI|nr:hypothetical protein [Parapedobacter defluvii]GGC14501.1 hypothetical protein GCM10011386_02770 [Parapedobacter defluvii]